MPARSVGTLLVQSSWVFGDTRKT